MSEMSLSLIEVIDGLREIIENPRMVALEQPETSQENLKWMCDTLLENLYLYPEDKINRWIGFVQGVMAAKGCLSVAAERERTRPLFHKAYAAQGRAIPPSVSR